MENITKEMILQQLKRHEGCVLHPYRDHIGYLTIGYGRLIDTALDGGISQDEADLMLSNDFDKYLAEAQKVKVFEKLNNARKAVIISMIFNLGLPRFLLFKNFIRAMEKDNFSQASSEMLSSKWAKQVGKRAVELALQMEKGVWS